MLKKKIFTIIAIFLVLSGISLLDGASTTSFTTHVTTASASASASSVDRTATSIENSVVVGVHRNNAFTEEEMTASMRDHADFYDEPEDFQFIIGVDAKSIVMKFYDSIVEMILALNRGELDYIEAPRCVANYVLRNNHNLRLKGIDWWDEADSNTFNFGFLKKSNSSNTSNNNKYDNDSGGSIDSIELLKSFNQAIESMQKDGTLAVLKENYIERTAYLPTAKFENFADAPTITIAVTGDLPPIDYVTADGVPSGFNVAVISEIAKRLHLNVKIMNINTGARMAALASGRVDVIFLTLGSKMDYFTEKNDLIDLSLPYYEYHEEYFIGVK